jgi:hypothetical protein
VVSTRALACRRCGKRQRVNPRWIILGLAAAAMGAMFAVAGLGSRASLGRSLEPLASARSKTRVPAAESPETQLTASDLWAAYNKDTAAADRRFRDKRVAVVGTLVAVPTRDFDGSLILRLGTDDMFEAVRATLARRAGLTTASFAKGQLVSVSCTGRGALIGAPILDDCTLR